jgi:hypothetical protein
MATSTTTAANGKSTAAPPAQSRVERRVAELRELAARSPELARDEAWTWFRELGEEAGRDREAATAVLNELFRAGVPPIGLDGRTEGILVTPLIAGPVDRALRSITSLWMPWAGKRFHASESRGDNVLRSSARWPAKLLWPLYGTKPIGGDRAAFDFETRVEPGKDDPDIDVLVIDYSVVDSNPSLAIKSIRDELVEIVPGANLGKILYRRGEDSYSLIGFFALRSPAG